MDRRILTDDHRVKSVSQLKTRSRNLTVTASGFWRRKRDLKLQATPLAVPEKIFGLTLYLDFFDRCANAVLAVSAAGGARRRCPRLRRSDSNSAWFHKVKYLPNRQVFYLAEKEGFEPSRRVSPTYSLSRGAPSPLGYFSKLTVNYDKNIMCFLPALRYYISISHKSQ